MAGPAPEIKSQISVKEEQQEINSSKMQHEVGCCLMCARLKERKKRKEEERRERRGEGRSKRRIRRK